jgi:hypothetical protein
MAIQRIDILEDENGDELIEDGDFAIGPADDFHIRDLLLDSPGDWRQYPEIGMLIDRYRNAPATKKRQFESELREALEIDGYRVKSVTLSMQNWWKDFIVDAEPIR